MPHIEIRDTRSFKILADEQIYRYKIVRNEADEIFVIDIETPIGPFGPGIFLPIEVIQDINEKAQDMRITAPPVITKAVLMTVEPDTIRIDGKNFESEFPVESQVAFQNPGGFLTKTQIVNAGGEFSDTQIKIPNGLVGGDETTAIIVIADGRSSDSVNLIKAPVIILADLLPLPDAKIEIDGTDLSSTTEFETNVILGGNINRTITQKDILGFGGTITDTQIIVPCELTQGVVEGITTLQVSAQGELSNVLLVS